MATHPIVVIPGDGIGPEVTAAVQRILAAAQAPIEWHTRLAGIAALEAQDEVLPGETIELIRRVGLALKGPCTTPVGEGFTSINVQLRKRLNLYAAVRPVRNLEGVTTRFDGVDLVIIRENTEGLYSGVENHVTDDVVMSMKVATQTACLRIRAVGVSIRHPPAAPQDHGLPQGQHHEADRRPVHQVCAKDPRAGVSEH